MLRGNYVTTGNDTIALSEHTISIVPILLIQRPGQCKSSSRSGNLKKLMLYCSVI